MRVGFDLFDAVETPAHLSGRPSGFLPRLPGMGALPAFPLPIAEMADLFGVTHRTLHFYEEKRLLVPGRTGTMRVYDSACVMRMMVINTCREIGVPLATVQELMDGLSRTGSQAEADMLFRRLISARRRELTSEVSQIARKVEQIHALLSDPAGETDAAATSGAPAARLSDLERRCLGLMTEGYRGGGLALALGICSGELQSLEKTIITKLDAGNRYQAAAKAILSGMLPN